MDMTYDTMDKDCHVKTLPLLADIDVRCPKYTFNHPGDLLFATQFAQIALVVTEKAAFEPLRICLSKTLRRIAHSLDTRSGSIRPFASIAESVIISEQVSNLSMHDSAEKDYSLQAVFHRGELSRHLVLFAKSSLSSLKKRIH